MKLYLRKQREMIRRLRGALVLLNYFAANETFSEVARYEDVVKSQMRIPNRKSVALLIRMQQTIPVKIT
jgi:hypothetical protein